MSHELGAQVETPDGVVPEGHVRVTELFLWIYRLLYSKTFGLCIILLFAVMALVGSLLPQMSIAVRDSEVAREQFLARLRPIYGGWVPILDTLGAFHIFTSIAFYVVVAALALSIIACTTHRIPELVERQYHPRTHVAPRFFDKARYRATIETSASLEQTRRIVESTARAAQWRVLPSDKDSERGLYVDQHAWSGIGTVLAHTAFVLILGAFVISSTYGVDEEVIVPVGSSVDIGHDTGLAVYAHSFTDTYTPEGQPLDYVSDVSILRGGEEIDRQEIRVNSPMTVGKYRLHQASFGHAVDIVATKGASQILFEGAVAQAWTSEDGRDVYGRVDLSDGTIVVVATAASGQMDSTIPPGVALFEIHADESSGAVARGQASQGASVSVGDYTFTFVREREYTAFTLRHDPGAVLMWIASALLIIGMTITFAFQYRRAWIRIDEAGNPQRQEVRLGAVSRLDLSFERAFKNLVARIETELPGDSTPHGTEQEENDDH
ncbi:cytochrome c biogenesis protein ResB [Schaalia suimastitidis]|uniref:cytochrome c biogenesis protein ResB n=1 Tax=Schaalia suimastitidis TaxID=121163 RepID=UPI000424E066|nr:cytochrome c biogenesis protein ResB [Schaalia suimastitidis]